MINFFKKLLGLGPIEVDTSAQAPYKIEAPVVVAAPVATPTANTNKARRPYRGKKTNKPAAKPAVTEGKAKGGTGAVKQQPATAKKPQAPKAPAKK